MQPATPPLPSYPAPAYPSRRLNPLLLLLVGALVLVAVAGVVGYLIGSAVVQQATLRVNVENRLFSSQTVSVLVNGKAQATLTVPASQTMSADVSVRYVASDGSLFEVEAVSTSGPRDSSTVLVNGPGIYVVGLRLG